MPRVKKLITVSANSSVLIVFSVLLSASRIAVVLITPSRARKRSGPALFDLLSLLPIRFVRPTSGANGGDPYYEARVSVRLPQGVLRFRTVETALRKGESDGLCASAQWKSIEN